VKKFKWFTRKLVSKLFENFGPIRVLFCVKNEIGFANQAPLMALMEKNPLFRIAVVKVTGDKLEFSNPDMQSLYNKHCISEKKARFSVWHYVVATDKRYFWLSWDSVGVNIEHGNCFGNGGRSKSGQKPWLQEVAEQNNVAIIVCSGRGVYEGLIGSSQDLRSNPEKAFLISGSPKLSNLADGKYDRASILLSLGLDPSRKTVLISSHWTEMSLLRDLDTSVVQLLREYKEELNIIITGHPKLWELTLSERNFDGQALLNRLKLISKQCPDRVRISPTGSPFELMAASDVLLCDHSSIRVEFSLLERPAGLYRNKNFKCESQTTDDLYRRSSEVFFDISSLDLAVKKILSPDYENSKSIKDLRHFFITDPSMGVEKFVNFLAECGRVGSPSSSRWKRVKKLEHEHLIRDLKQR
tara:strand:- start:7118 stop:8356 length:1239 start_codon:yes stop_codon:yes gene_type:complete